MSTTSSVATSEFKQKFKYIYSLRKLIPDRYLGIKKKLMAFHYQRSTKFIISVVNQSLQCRKIIIKPFEMITYNFMCYYYLKLLVQGYSIITLVIAPALSRTECTDAVRVLKYYVQSEP